MLNTRQNWDDNQYAIEESLLGAGATHPEAQEIADLVYENGGNEEHFGPEHAESMLALHRSQREDRDYELDDDWEMFAPVLVAKLSAFGATGDEIDEIRDDVHANITDASDSDEFMRDLISTHREKNQRVVVWGDTSHWGGMPPCDFSSDWLLSVHDQAVIDAAAVECPELREWLDARKENGLVDCEFIAMMTRPEWDQLPADEAWHGSYAFPVTPVPAAPISA